MNRKVFNCDVNECIRLFFVPYGFYILLKKNSFIAQGQREIVLYCVLSFFLFGCTWSLLWCAGFSSCDVRASECAGSIVLVPQPGIEPTPPALEGEFLTTGLPGKSQYPKFYGFAHNSYS